VAAFANTFGLSFPILLEAGATYQQYVQAPSASPFPLDYVIDQSGQIAYFNTEYDPENMVGVIDQLLGNAPLLVVDPASLDFGAVGVGYTEHLLLEIGNAGNGELRIAGITAGEGPFAANLEELVVPPGAARSLRISFTPHEVGPATGNLVLESNDPGQSLVQISLFGVGVEISSAGDRETTIPAVQLNCWPNPFNPLVTIEYRLTTGGAVRLQVFDLRGRRLRTLLDANKPMGRHRVRFDGTDDAGRRLPTGEYFAVLQTPQGTVKQKMVLVR